MLLLEVNYQRQQRRHLAVKHDGPLARANARHRFSLVKLGGCSNIKLQQEDTQELFPAHTDLVRLKRCSPGSDVFVFGATLRSSSSFVVVFGP